MMTILGIIFLAILICCFGSIIGWILEILGYIISFIFEGFCHLLGCFGTMIIYIIAIGAIIALLGTIV